MAPLIDYLAGRNNDYDDDDDDDDDDRTLQYQVHVHHDTTTRQQQQKKKMVSFSEFSELYYVLCIDEMTKEEYEASYMTSEDFRRIKKENQITIQEMEQIKKKKQQQQQVQVQNNNDDDNNESSSSSSMLLLKFRGLENQSKIGRKLKMERIAYFRYVVLNEQKQTGFLSTEWVMTYLSLWQVPFAHAAHMMGIYDSYD